MHKKPLIQNSRLQAEGQVLPFEVIIMAGGKGERLLPLTDRIPKPLLPLGGKPIVQYLLERLAKAGIRDFTFCLNYLGDQVERYFGNGEEWKVDINYLFETEPLGTIGGLALKEKFRYNDLLIINADLLTNINFERFFTFYLEQDADLAVATIPYNINLPYGIIETGEEQEISSIREKPTFTYHINSGIYLLRRELIDLIPKGDRYDAVDLIQTALSSSLKVSSYPLLDYWIDIGKPEDYEKAKKDIGFLDL